MLLEQLETLVYLVQQELLVQLDCRVAEVTQVQQVMQDSLVI